MAAKSKKSENPFLSLICNIVLPTVILLKLSGPEQLGPKLGLLASLGFPLAYGLYDWWQRRTLNFISVLGFASILISGGLGLLALDGFWFAVKEASIPAVIGVALLVSAKSSKPLVRVFLFNDKVVHVDKVTKALTDHNKQKDFDKELVTATYLVTLSFFVSAVLNFFLAYVLLKSPAGTPEFNEELGYMTAISYPVILVCSSSILIIALWRLVHNIKKMTGLEYEAIFKS